MIPCGADFWETKTTNNSYHAAWKNMYVTNIALY
jgi:hypothetical protein